MQNQFNNLEPIEQDIVDYLKTYCNGIEHAISNEALSRKFSMDKRTIGNLITHLITNHNVPIGSCSRNHSGIYYCDTDQDFKIAHRELIKRIKELSRRARHLRYGYYDSVRNKQLQLI